MLIALTCCYIRFFSITFIGLYNLIYLPHRIAKDPRFQRLACTHKGTYADDCIVERVTQVKALPSSMLFVCLEHEYWEYSVKC